MPPIVLVIWEDAKVLTEGAWATNQEYEYTPHMVSQVGFLLLDVPEGIHITEAWHPELIGPVEQIPRGMIRKLTFLLQT